MASKQHLQERIDKWNIKINGYREKIAKYEDRLAKALKLLSKSVGEEVTVDTYEQYGRVDFDNYMRVSNAIDGIETNERNIRYAEREIRDIQYKLDEVLKKEKEFDYDLEGILQDKLSEFKVQWIERMNAYYTKLWHSMKKNAQKAKILLAQLEEERRTLSYREYHRWKELDNKISDCKKVIYHESMQYDTPEAYVDSMQEDIVRYFNDAIKRLVVKCYKFNIDRNNLEVSYPEVTEKGMECFIKDLTNNKVIWARMIWAAEYSDYMVPHVRYIVTERKK